MSEAFSEGANKHNQVQFQIASALHSARIYDQDHFLNAHPNCASSCGFMLCLVCITYFCEDVV